MARKSKNAKAEQKAVKPVVKAVSVEKMIDENRKAVHTSDYQTYVRKLMREASERF